MKTYSESQPKLAAWAEENLPEGFAVFAFPEAHRKGLQTSNTCENGNGQIKEAHPRRRRAHRNLRGLGNRQSLPFPKVT